MLWVTMVRLKRKSINETISKRSFAGFTPLMRSAIIGDGEITRALIENGANVNATNNDGDSALMVAALNSKHGL